MTPRGSVKDADLQNIFLFKFLMVGSSGSGKSCLLVQMMDNSFPTNTHPTIGVEIRVKVVPLGNNHFAKVQLWDTAGQEAFRSVVRSYYRGAAGGLLVFDISRRETFDELKHWLTEFREGTSDEAVLTLIGNKCDLNAKRAVTVEEAKKFAEENGLIYFETSAKTAENTNKAFLDLVNRAYNNVIKKDDWSQEIESSTIKLKPISGSERTKREIANNRKCCF